MNRFSLSKHAYSTIVLVTLLSSQNALADVVSAGTDSATADRVISTSATERPAMSPRIIGGQRATIGELPGVVSLVYSTPANLSIFERQYCGGTLIQARWVLTAAHCVSDEVTNQPFDADTVRVVGNAHDLLDSTLVESVVSNVYVHPLFDVTSSYRYDIALLELAESIEGDVAELFAGQRASVTGEDIHVAGWGVVDFDDFGNALHDSVLREVSLPLVDNSICNQPQSYSGYIVDSQFCAGYATGGYDSCQGDSGGPAYTGEPGDYRQIGIVSFGEGCALADKYGVYTDIASFHGWLRDYVPEIVPEGDGGGLGGDGASADDDDAFLGSLGWLEGLAMVVLCCLRGKRFEPGRHGR